LIEPEVDPDTKAEIDKKIDLIFKNVIDSKENKLLHIQRIFECLTHLDRSMDKFYSFFICADPIQGEDTVTIRKRKAMFSILTFGFIFDMYLSLLDILIYLLILDKHDLYNFERNKYAHTIEDIGRINIETKYKFLHEHNLDIFIRRNDQVLRNKIAHNDFQVIDEINGIIARAKIIL